MSYPTYSFAVDIILYCKPKNSVLLIRRSYKSNAFPGQLALPGGFVDPNETSEQAAYRELSEETGIKIEQLHRIDVYDAVHRDPRQRVIGVAYGAVVDEEVIGYAADDAIETGWYNVDMLPDLAFDHKQIITDARSKFNEDNS